MLPACPLLPHAAGSAIYTEGEGSSSSSRREEGYRAGYGNQDRASLFLFFIPCSSSRQASRQEATAPTKKGSRQTDIRNCSERERERERVNGRRRPQLSKVKRQASPSLVLCYFKWHNETQHFRLFRCKLQNKLYFVSKTLLSLMWSQ
jgi:hypothetical protein